ncbi:MAG: DNA methyltransferase [Patescibacteria group bacterium]|jgi:type I restriction-modification system DNA methylase subunit
MAGLFKNKIIKENLGVFEITNFEEKVSILKSWLNAYKNGELQKKTETQCEQSFNQDIFVKVLGYETFPREVYSLLPKANVETGGGQMPDAILGYFDQAEKRVIGVVEIKDANTSLDKSQYRQGNLTPIQQAFKYKPQYKECGFVIATNFIEIRLFRDNQLDYEQFTLRELVDPKDDYFNFRKFYYLLSAQNFISKSGQTSTEKLLSAIRIEQEEITNKFYKEYKTLREDLIKDIVNNNKIKRSEFYNLIVEKAQKIIDRIVFICFFEDAGLLPERKLIEVVEYGDRAGLSIWSVMKDFFKAVDSGSVKMEIPDGYNGELFKQDNDLNNLIISDEICKKFVKLSRFDFSEDLSVNILGHIFEQSITDLERLKSFSVGDNEGQGKKQNKRNKEGIFYTREYIVDYIVKNSLGKYLEEKEFEIINKYNLDDKRLKDSGYNKKIIKAYVEYSNFLKTIKIIDPACGSGAFLVRVYDYLLAEHKRIFKIISEAEGTAGNNLLISDEEYIKPILENNIYGVDLNMESVEITKLSLWFKSAKKGKKLITLKDNIKCGNSLINDMAVAGKKAFDWDREFPEIMQKGGFDIVIGNPPYVDSETMVKNNPVERKSIADKFLTASGNWDLYIPFIEKAKSLIKKGGYASMIVPNKWLSMDYGLALRNLIHNNIILLSDLSKLKVFDDANITSSIFVIKNSNELNIEVSNFIDSSNYTSNIINKKELDPNNWGSLFADNFYLIKKIDSSTEPLEKYSDISGAFTTSEAYELIDFIKDINTSDNKNYFKLVNTGTIDKYYTVWGLQETTYLKNKYLHPVISSGDLKENFGRRFNRFNCSKIIVSGIRHFECILDHDNEYIAGKSTTVIKDVTAPLDLFSLICILNSSLMTFYIKNKYSTSGMGGGINFSPSLVKKIPIKISNLKDEQKKDFRSLYFDLVNQNKKLLNQMLKIKTLLTVEAGLNKLKDNFNYLGLNSEKLNKILKENVANTEKRLQIINLIEKEADILKLIDNEIKNITSKIDKTVLSIYEISLDNDIQLILNYKSV